MRDGVGNDEKFEMFSEGRIALQREVNKHPILVALIQQAAAEGNGEWGDQIGEIAAFCGIAMDGMYTHSELEYLYPELYFKLKEARTVI